MKKVVSNDELKKVMLDGINLICDAVSSTLGPSGNNVLINKSDLAPFITNDGVTIAESICSEDERINSVLEIVKEASLKTNEVVGDGTTTTLVLLQSIYTLGLKEVLQGKNPIELKKELFALLDKIIIEIDKVKKEATEEDLINIATISAGDKEIGEYLAKLYLEIKNIKIEEGKGSTTSYQINNGYNVNTSELNNVYFQKRDRMELKDCYILLLNGYLNDLESISNIINEGLDNNKNILIIASEYEESLKDELLIYYLQEHKNIFLVSVSEYGKKKEDIMKDIAYITNSKIKNVNYEDILWSDLGTSHNVIIKREEINITSDKDCAEIINELKKEQDNCDDTYDKDFLEERIGKLSQKSATILVGGITSTEIKEKKMRMDDALCALKCACKGIVIGEGLTLLRVSELLNDNDIASRIIKESLTVPFYKILENSGISPLEIYKKIKDSQYKLIYNIEKEEFESIEESKIIDPYIVVIEALKNAVSIASMLLTTNYLVIDSVE